MRKSFCDRCDAETTGVTSGHVMGIEDADDEGNGNISRTADLCVRCYRAWLKWLEPQPVVLKDDRRTNIVDARSAGSAHPDGGDRG